MPLVVLFIFYASFHHKHVSRYVVLCIETRTQFKTHISAALVYPYYSLPRNPFGEMNETAVLAELNRALNKMSE